MPHKLENYLRTYRKRAGLSQRETAYLLGCQTGNKASRYECFVREPGLQTVLAYEALFRVPSRELFAGAYEKVERQIAKRARTLAQQVAHEPSSPMRDHKLAVLTAVVRPATRKRTTHT